VAKALLPVAVNRPPTIRNFLLNQVRLSYGHPSSCANQTAPAIQNPRDHLPGRGTIAKLVTGKHEVNITPVSQYAIKIFFDD
jgi:DUF971 family protein